jgi:peptide-methionine (R)-S-oxide reductase
MSGNKIKKTEEEWREALTPEQYRVLREAGTERAFTGELTDRFDPGLYRCAGCGQELFSAETKFHSGCGWPSFSDADPDKVVMRDDSSHGMRRTEVLCSNCGGHLGHVFPDGPLPTGQRYCINSVSLKFDPKADTVVETSK